MSNPEQTGFKVSTRCWILLSSVILIILICITPFYDRFHIKPFLQGYNDIVLNSDIPILERADLVISDIDRMINELDSSRPKEVLQNEKDELSKLSSIPVEDLEQYRFSLSYDLMSNIYAGQSTLKYGFALIIVIFSIPIFKGF